MAILGKMQVLLDKMTSKFCCLLMLILVYYACCLK